MLESARVRGRWGLLVCSRGVQSPDRSRRIWAGVRVLGLIVLVAVLLRQIEWAAVVASFRGIGPGEAAVVLAAVLVAMGLRLWKWQVQLQAMDLAQVPAPTVARGFLLGVLLGAVTPLRLGEFYRIAAATPGAGEARNRAAAGVLLDKGYELLVVLVTLAVGAVATLPAVVGAVAWALVVAIAWLVLGPAGAHGPGPLGRSLGLMAAAKACLGAGDRARLLAATTGAHALNLAAGLVIYRAFGELAVGDYLLRVPMITLLNTVPMTIGGFGLRELTAMQLFGAIAYPAAGAAVAAAALFFAANVLPALLLLPVVVAAERRRA